MEEPFYVLDTENHDLIVGGKMMGGGKLMSKTSLGSDCRMRLSDISNNLKRISLPNQDEKERPVMLDVGYMEQLQKENMALKKLLAERNKIIELSKMEFIKIRANLQKVQQQNWQLAQTNSQMLTELNRGKDRLKAMEHDLGCKATLLYVKEMELKEKTKKKPNDKIWTKKNQTEKCENTKGEEAVPVNASTKTSNIIMKRRPVRSQSLGPCPVRGEAMLKEKLGDESLKAEEPESTNEKADNKRQCLRRQSAKFVFEASEPSKDASEFRDSQESVTPLVEEILEESGDTLPNMATTKAKQRKHSIKCETPVPGRTSIGRPTRRAAEKVNYKEIPLNVKMRRG